MPRRRRRRLEPPAASDCCALLRRGGLVAALVPALAVVRAAERRVVRRRVVRRLVVGGGVAVMNPRAVLVPSQADHAAAGALPAVELPGPALVRAVEVVGHRLVVVVAAVRALVPFPAVLRAAEVRVEVGEIVGATDELARFPVVSVSEHEVRVRVRLVPDVRDGGVRHAQQEGDHEHADEAARALRVFTRHDDTRALGSDGRGRSASTDASSARDASRGRLEGQGERPRVTTSAARPDAPINVGLRIEAVKSAATNAKCREPSRLSDGRAALVPARPAIGAISPAPPLRPRRAAVASRSRSGLSPPSSSRPGRSAAGA